MAKKRLSKLQNWILRQIYQNDSINKKGLKKFYGKGLQDALTNKERVIIHRSLNNMLNKDLIDKGQYKNYILTEKGFNKLLNVNTFHVGATNVNFKEYLRRQQKSQQEYEQWLDVLKQFCSRKKTNVGNYTESNKLKQENALETGG